MCTHSHSTKSQLTLHIQGCDSLDSKSLTSSKWAPKWSLVSQSRFTACLRALYLRYPSLFSPWKCRNRLPNFIALQVHPVTILQSFSAGRCPPLFVDLHCQHTAFKATDTSAATPKTISTCEAESVSSERLRLQALQSTASATVHSRGPHLGVMTSA
jgi:hypothetical protein